MPLSLRIPLEKDQMIKRAAAKRKKTKTTFILEAVDEKLGLVKAPEQIIRELAGWLSQEKAQELREAVEVFNDVNEGDRESIPRPGTVLRKRLIVNRLRMIFDLTPPRRA